MLLSTAILTFFLIELSLLERFPFLVLMRECQFVLFFCVHSIDDIHLTRLIILTPRLPYIDYIPPAVHLQCFKQFLYRWLIIHIKHHTIPTIINTPHTIARQSIMLNTLSSLCSNAYLAFACRSLLSKSCAARLNNALSLMNCLIALIISVLHHLSALTSH